MSRSQINQNILNVTYGHKRKIKNVSPSGAVSHDYAILGTIKGRKTRNRLYGGSGDIALITISEHKIFTNPELDSLGYALVQGDILTDGVEEYTITYIDKAPSGEKSHHYEVYVNLSNVSEYIS